LTTGLTLISIVVLAFLYVRCLAYVVSGDPVRFRVVGLLVLATAVGLLSAVGFAWDALTIVLLIFYAALSGALWRRFIGRWSTSNLTTAVWTSASILSSFLVVLALGAMFVYEFDAVLLKSWKSAYWSMFPTAYISMEYIWHDEANSTAQFFLYGLPFGLPVNVAVGLLAGAALGLVATSIRSFVSD
jgi:flagellar biosynthesis protein FliR